MKSSQARAAALIRKALKAHGVKASVRSSSASMTSSVNVGLVDMLPATVDKITEYCNQYGYENYKRIDNVPQARFVFVNPSYSDELRAEAKAYVAENFDLSTMSDHDVMVMERQVLRGSVQSSFWTSRKPRIAA